MLRDFKFSRRNSGKSLKFEETENVPVNVHSREPSVGRLSTDSHSRPPLNAIHEPSQNPSKGEQALGFKSSKVYRTPTKPKTRNPEFGMPLKTPEKQGGLSRNRYGWGQDSRDDGRIGNVNTPKQCRMIPRASSCLREPNSAHSTPGKSASKLPNPGFVNGGSSRPPVNGGLRTGNFTALSKGIPVAFNTCTTVNTVEVPHFDLREDPSFWMDHNVQVLIRIRPLNDMEISSQGYSRCLKQDSAQSLTWVAQPETRFTFDHVACETIDQETLFNMVGLPMVENCLSGYNSCMFAYGQTGSGKTHTMLGQINDLETKPSPNRGMTPRIFEFLFARIFAEEESRKDERLKYNCKCSFLEIYNEQITDLLDPSSTNLQLREDVKKGVYVENLTEYDVHCVGDILQLLSQGSANRRVAATNMNRESSRSHSVFTCEIESRWEKDATSNVRFARLNLVDLAGSERQKTSGAEGERLKEASSINKSLSTLGHVIMVLVDGANARTRHVPYRDSRLTFLLQDSLGGNSKTMIIANVSPSISSATETLNTLKFAQRAKLIQNNAVINEDASGDVAALQHQIRLLKEELATLKRQNISRSLTFNSKDENCSSASSFGDDDKHLRVSCKQLKSLECSLNGALRREKSTENCIKQLEAEIEQLNSLVRQREEENRCTKMMLKFREDKIQKMEAVLSGLISADTYLIEENNTLTEEIKILRAKVDRNPEVTRFAVENIRLLEQLRRFQDFYEDGEREMLLTEVSELRDQLVLFLDENNHMNQSTEKKTAEDKREIYSLQSKLEKSEEELQKCRDNLNSCIENNAKLCREISDLNALLEMQKSLLSDQDGSIEVLKESILESSSIEGPSSHTVQEKDEILQKNAEDLVNLQLELEFLKTILKEERLIYAETEEKYAKSILKEKEAQQELPLLREKCEEKDEILQKDVEELVNLQLELEFLKTILKEERLIYAETEENYAKSILKEKEAHQELALLREKCEEKDRNCNTLSKEFDSLINKIEEVLTVGCNALDDASNIIGNGKQRQGCENLQIIARKLSEKQLRIDEINTCLEDAKRRGNEMESMLRSLRGASLVMSEAHQQDCIKKDEEIDKLLSELAEKNSIITQMEEQRKLYDVELIDEKMNAARQVVESCCYFDKFIEIHNDIKEADLIIKKLVTETETMKREISHQNQVIGDKYFDLENEKNQMSAVFEKLKEMIIISYYDMQMKDSILLAKDEEVNLLLKENKLYELQLTDAKTNAAQQEVESCCYLNKFLEIQSNLKKADFMINTLVTENMVLKKEKASMSKVLEKFKEAILISHLDLHFEGLILLEINEEMRLLKEENETLVVKINNQRDEIAKSDGLCEDLECELYENMVKSVVLDSWSVGIVEDAVHAKKSIEQLTYFQELYELELTNAKKKVQEADLLISKLVTKNEAVKTEISHQNQVIDAKEIESFIIFSFSRSLLSEATCSSLDKMINDLISFASITWFWWLISVFNASVSVTTLLISKSASCTFFFALLYELQLTHAKTNAAQKEVESCCYLDKFLEIQSNLKKADFMINTLVTDNMVLKTEKASMSNVFEKFKEAILVSHLDLHFKDLILLEMNEEMRLLKEENETLVVKINNQRDEIAKFDGFCKDLECELYENIVKSVVLDSWSIEIAEDALHAKKSIEQLTYFQELYELELTNAKKKVQEADLLINKLVTENEAVKTEISHQNQVIDAKEIESFIILSRLEQAASDNNDLEKEKINVYSDSEKLKDEVIISCVDLHFKDLMLQEKDAEIGVLQMACETSKRYNEEKLKLYEKSVEELESTVNLLENQVDLVKGDAESQRLKKEELEQELQKMRQKKQLLITENESRSPLAEVSDWNTEGLEPSTSKGPFGSAGLANSPRRKHESHDIEEAAIYDPSTSSNMEVDSNNGAEQVSSTDGSSFGLEINTNNIQNPLPNASQILVPVGASANPLHTGTVAVNSDSFDMDQFICSPKENKIIPDQNSHVEEMAASSNGGEMQSLPDLNKSLSPPSDSFASVMNHLTRVVKKGPKKGSKKAKEKSSDSEWASFIAGISTPAKSKSGRDHPST